MTRPDRRHFPSRVAEAWRARIKELAVEINRWPDSPRMDYRKIQLKILTSLLWWYGREARLLKVDTVRSRPTWNRPVGPPREIRTGAQLRGILLRIAAANRPG